MKPFFYFNGVTRLAKMLKGSENIYLGIRPYGFHAGNATTLVVYPYLLCRELQKLGKEPSFTLYVFLNDWEQDSLDGPDLKLYPFNVLPKFTTWQYVKDPLDETKYIVDLWEKIIISNISVIQHYFPKIKIVPCRNSSMKKTPEMKKCILKTIKNPDVLMNILKEFTSKKFLDKPTIFASAVCPKCKAARGESSVEVNGNILHRCQQCNAISQGSYDFFDFWLYHKPLALPRIEANKIDLCITGLDHYAEGDFMVRKKLFEQYEITVPFPKTLYAPSILGSDGQVMGKSKGNAKLVDLDKLIHLVLEQKNMATIQIPQKL